MLFHWGATFIRKMITFQGLPATLLMKQIGTKLLFSSVVKLRLSIFDQQKTQDA